MKLLTLPGRGTVLESEFLDEPMIQGDVLFFDGIMYKVLTVEVSKDLTGDVKLYYIVRRI